MKIALVHDYLGEFGGAERVLSALSEIWPDAPIYTAFWRSGEAWDRFKDKDVRVSWVHHIPGFATRLHSPLRFLAPFVWQSFDFSDYDVVLSSASWYITKGFGTRGTAKKKPIEICYCHTPPRWLYGYPTSVEWQKYSVVRAYASVVGFFMRHYDYTAAQRVNYFIANSQNTARRIEKFYRRESTVIYPPATLFAGARADSPRLYYLVVSRLAQPKNIDVAIAVAKETGIKLKIVGTGPDEERLRALAGKNVDFLGHVDDKNLPGLYERAKAFLALATDEDFGMTPVEAMSAGTPVIALRSGGYLESMIEGKTGVFVNSPTVDGVAQAIHRFQEQRFLPEDCRAQAEKFSKKRFQKEMKAFVGAHKNGI